MVEGYLRALPLRAASRPTFPYLRYKEEIYLSRLRQHIIWIDIAGPELRMRFMIEMRRLDM